MKDQEQKLPVTHTPGPWIVWEPEFDDGPAIGAADHILIAREIPDDCHHEIARVWCNSGFTDYMDQVAIPSQLTEATAPAEVLANARLIAAAPELLAALQGVLRVADRATDEFDAARAAIQKATANPENI